MTEHESLINYLRVVLQEGRLRKYPGLEQNVSMVLMSPNREFIPMMANYVRTLNLTPPEQETPEPLWKVPSPAELPKLGIHIADTIPGGNPVILPQRCFGGDGHIKMDGLTGSGKSILLNSMAVQIPVPFAMYDEMDKWSGMLAAVLPHDRLRIIDLATYKRNILMGPEGIDQIQWIAKAGDYLMEVLDLEPIAMRHVVRICEQIIADGQIANIPRLIARLSEKDMSQRAIRSLAN